MPSLAKQLTKSTLLTNKTQSYLFTAKEAAQHDLESLHALALSALPADTDLIRFSKLFGDSSKDLDRALLTKEDNEKLNKLIKDYLALLSPNLLSARSGRILEWLVRRFR